jgi:hypothetical protein
MTSFISWRRTREIHWVWDLTYLRASLIAWSRGRSLTTAEGEAYSDTSVVKQAARSTNDQVIYILELILCCNRLGQMNACYLMPQRQFLEPQFHSPLNTSSGAINSYAYGRNVTRHLLSDILITKWTLLASLVLWGSINTTDPHFRALINIEILN